MFEAGSLPFVAVIGYKLYSATYRPSLLCAYAGPAQRIIVCQYSERSVTAESKLCIKFFVCGMI